MNLHFLGCASYRTQIRISRTTSHADEQTEYLKLGRKMPWHGLVHGTQCACLETTRPTVPTCMAMESVSSSVSFEFGDQVAKKMKPGNEVIRKRNIERNAFC